MHFFLYTIYNGDFIIINCNLIGFSLYTLTNIMEVIANLELLKEIGVIFFISKSRINIK